MVTTPRATTSEQANRDTQAIIQIQDLWGKGLDKVRLGECGELLERVASIVSKRVPKDIEALEIVLRGMVAESRRRKKVVDLRAPDYISAYGEAIGIRDERFPGDPQLKAGRSDTDYCLLRAGFQIGKDRGSGHLASPERVRDRLVRVRWDILAAFDAFISQPELVERAVRDFYAEPGSSAGGTADDASMVGTANPGASPLGSSDAATAGYIHREREEVEFHHLVAEEDAKLIIFVGHGGMGKTTLARVVTGGASQIRFKGGSIIRSDLEAAFTRHGFDRTHLSLAELVCSINAPEYVIIDGLESADELSEILPAGDIRSIVVATCRSRGRTPLKDCHFIDVRGMSFDDAVEFIQLELAEVSTDDARNLAVKLNFHASSINYVCRLISQHKISLKVLFLQLDDQVPWGWTLRISTGGSLHVIRLRTIGNLAVDNDIAYVAYEALHVFGSSNARFLQAVACVAMGRYVSMIECVEATDELRRLSLIDRSPIMPNRASLIRLIWRDEATYSKRDACKRMARLCRYLIINQAMLKEDSDNLLFAAGYYSHLYFNAPSESSDCDDETWRFIGSFHANAPKAMRDGFMTAECRMNVDPANEFLESTSDKEWY